MRFAGNEFGFVPPTYGKLQTGRRGNMSVAVSRNGRHSIQYDSRKPYRSVSLSRDESTALTHHFPLAAAAKAPVVLTMAELLFFASRTHRRAGLCPPHRIILQGDTGNQQLSILRNSCVPWISSARSQQAPAEGNSSSTMCMTVPTSFSDNLSLFTVILRLCTNH